MTTKTTPSWLTPLRTTARWLLAIAMAAVGIMHFAQPEPFLRIVPAMLPAPLALVYISGVFELLGGVGLLIPRLRNWAGWGLIALYLAVFPANLNMALNNISLNPDEPLSPLVLWGRLPFQLLFIAWAYWVSRDEPKTTGEVAPPSREA